MDPQVVLDSARANPAYGLAFEYGHNARVGSLATLLGAGAAIGGAVAVAQLRPGRDWLLSLKAQGDGPDEEQRRRGRFNLRFHGESRRRRVRVEVSGGDPGYSETAKMLAESGLCLALDGRQLSPAAGFMSSAAAMAAPLVARLQRAGIDFEVLENEAL
jgi:short subunit dehydrogenase-like uncharacterized protein